MSRWQVRLQGRWQDFGEDEGLLLDEAYQKALDAGKDSFEVLLRKLRYRFELIDGLPRTQINLGSGKARDVRLWSEDGNRPAAGSSRSLVCLPDEKTSDSLDLRPPLGTLPESSGASPDGGPSVGDGCDPGGLERPPTDTLPFPPGPPSSTIGSVSKEGPALGIGGSDGVVSTSPDLKDASIPVGFDHSPLRASNSIMSLGFTGAPVDIDNYRFFVWRRGEWHPMGADEEDEIKHYLRQGECEFTICGGKWLVDTARSDGWVQIAIDQDGKEGKTLNIKYERSYEVLNGVPGSRPADSHAAVGMHSVPEDHVADVSPVVNVSTSRKVPMSSMYFPPTRFPSTLEQELVTTIRAEWARVAGGKNALKLGEFKAAIHQGMAEHKPPNPKQKQLIEQTAWDMFNKLDLSRSNATDEAEWLHYRLLELQAPSFHALAQVNEKLVLWCKGGSGKSGSATSSEVLGHLLRLFEKGLATSTESSQYDPRVSAEYMREAAKEWLGFITRSKVKENDDRNAGDVKAHLRRLSLCSDETPEDEKELEDDEKLSYYDFLNHCLGRKAAPVKINLYDISNGAASWLAPLIVGQRVEGVWHSGVVVHGKEYWYGGSLFESVPGTTPFGEPTKTILLDKTTMRTRNDLWNFIARELAHEYTGDNYDLLTHNCNHFSDELVQFLVNDRLPEDVRKQPELAAGSTVIQMLRPLLNAQLGGFGEESMHAAANTGTSVSNGAKTEEWARLDVEQLVIYEYEPGWSCIGLITDKDDDKMECEVEWVNVRRQRIQPKGNISRTAVSPLKEGTRRERLSGASGGMFACCLKSPTGKR